MPATVRLTAAGLGRLLAGVIACLLALDLIVEAVKFSTGHNWLFGLTRLVSLDREMNLPTWYSSSVLLGCAVLLLVIASHARRLHDRFTGHWYGLAAVFAYLSLDEAAEIHEMTIRPLRSLFNTAGLLYSAWVILGAAFVSVIGLLYLRFLRSLPRSTRRRIVAAASLYVGGALGVESVAARSIAIHGADTVAYALLVVLEEGLEMAGVAVFLCTLVSYLHQQAGEIRVLLAEPSAHEPAATPRTRASVR
ncbi:hypothetical protein [Candidatus Nitrospira bockiana]